jgi:hypothetical protein
MFYYYVYNQCESFICLDLKYSRNVIAELYFVMIF